MKVLVAGATGAIGTPLVTRLLAHGHEIIALTHSKEKAQVLTQQGIKALECDVLNGAAVHAALTSSEPEAVINMLTSLPREYTLETMRAAAEHDALVRQKGGGNLLAAARAARVRRYIIQSSAFFYAPGPGLAKEETPFAFNATPGVVANAHVYAELERALFQVRQLESVALRFGFFYGPGTWYSPEQSIADQVRERGFPIVDGGHGVWSFIHIEDAADAAVAALRCSPGIYNITDDQPSEMSVWLPAYAKWLGAPSPLTVSMGEAAAAKGQDAVYYAMRLRGASNAKAKQHLGFSPRPLEWLTETKLAKAI